MGRGKVRGMNLCIIEKDTMHSSESGKIDEGIPEGLSDFPVRSFC